MTVEAVKEAAKAVHAPEQRNVEAEPANIEVRKINGEAEEAEAEKGPCDWDYFVTEKDMAPSGPDYKKQKPNAFRCTFCGVRYGKKENFQNHQKEEWAKKTKCQLCGNKLNCMALKKHMKHIHGNDFPWIVNDR